MRYMACSPEKMRYMGFMVVGVVILPLTERATTFRAR